MGMDGEEADTCWVDASNYKICADMALVTKQVLFQHCHDRGDTGRPASREGMEFEVRGDQGSSEFSICSGAGAGTPDGRRDEVKLFAIL